MSSQSKTRETAPREPAAGIDYGHLPSLVGYRIRKAYSYLFQTFNAMLKDLNLAPGQYSVLLLIDLNPGLSQLAIAEATGLDGSTIVPITNRFVKLGWIRRTRRKDDRRFYALRTTPDGHAILERARPIIEAHERRLVSGLNEHECHVLTELLARIGGNSIEPQSAAPSRRARKATSRAVDGRARVP